MPPDICSVVPLSVSRMGSRIFGAPLEATGVRQNVRFFYRSPYLSCNVFALLMLILL